MNHDGHRVLFLEKSDDGGRWFLSEQMQISGFAQPTFVRRPVMSSRSRQACVHASTDARVGLFRARR